MYLNLNKQDYIDHIYINHLSIVLQEIITLLLDVAINHNSLDAIKSLGIFICILGITTHVILRTMYKGEL